MSNPRDSRRSYPTGESCGWRLSREEARHLPVGVRSVWAREVARGDSLREAVAGAARGPLADAPCARTHPPRRCGACRRPRARSWCAPAIGAEARARFTPSARCTWCTGRIRAAAAGWRTMPEVVLHSLDDFVRGIAEQPRVMLFKHSPICPISAAALVEWEAFRSALPAAR